MNLRKRLNLIDVGAECEDRAAGPRGGLVPHSYLAQSVLKVVSQKSIPTQIRQIILYIRNSKG